MMADECFVNSFVDGIGRPVIGRVNVPAELAGKINWTIGNSSINSKVNVAGPKTNPAATAPTARTINGPVITSGDS